MRITNKILLALVLVLNTNQYNANYSSVKTSVLSNQIPRVFSKLSNVKSIAVTNPPTVTETSSVTRAVTRTLSDFHLLIKSLLEYFSSSPIRDDTILLLHKTVVRLTDSLEKFGARILDAAEEVAKNIFLSLKHKLNNLEEEYKNLSRLTDENFERIIIYVNNTMMEQTLLMESWANNLKRQLRSKNDTAIYRKLCPAIDALIKDSTAQLSGCCNIVIKPVKSICRNVRIILRETFHVVADVVETVENCIFSEEKFDTMVISCLEDIYDDVSSLMDRTAALRNSLMTQLPTRILLSNYCISMVSVTMASRKTDVEQQIEYLNN